jgi:hypothetical protein
VCSGFTSINAPIRQPAITQAVSQSSHGKTGQDRTHATARQLVSQYLGIGGYESEISPFQRRASIGITGNNREEHTEFSSTSLNQLSKKRSSATPLKSSKKAKTVPKQDVHEKTRETEIGGKTKNFRSMNSNKSVNTKVPPSPPNGFAPSEHTMQRLSAWMYRPLSLPLLYRTSRQLSDHVSSEANVANISRVKSPRSCPSTSEVSWEDHNFSNVKIPFSIGISSQPMQSTHRASQHNIGLQHELRSKSRLLETVPEECPLPLDLRSQREQVALHNTEGQTLLVADQDQPDQPTHGTLDTLTYNLFNDDVFDGISDDDLLDLDMPDDFNKTIQVLQVNSSKQNPSDLRDAATVLTPQPSDPLLSSPNFLDIDRYKYQDGWISDEDIDHQDLTGNILEDITSATSSALLLDRAPKNGSQSKITLVTEQHLSCPETRKDHVHSIMHPPIVRPLFPQPIRDRSPLIGFTSTTCLRTCFRIGEALNIGCTAARNDSQNISAAILIELYARVVSSQRDETGARQHFVFSDLFHESRPPFINGVCECWKGSELWTYDCGRFLNNDVDTEKKLCRTIGQIKRERKEWQFVILNIWEATWEDVEYIRGIICS